MTEQRDIRGVLISVTQGRLLLPNASVAEVITYSEPEPVPGAPDWLMGRVRWRGWRLPLVSFARLAGWAPETGQMGAKVAVLKALGNNAKLPFFAVMSQGFPRLVTVTEAALGADADSEEVPEGVLARVRLNEDDALLPDLATLEAQINDALAAAA